MPTPQCAAETPPNKLMEDIPVQYTASRFTSLYYGLCDAKRMLSR